MSLLIFNHLIYDVAFFSISFTEKWIPNVIISHRYKAQDTPARRTFEQALTGAFMSAVIKDLRPSALPFVASLIRHYTMVAVAQQCGERQMFRLLTTASIGILVCPDINILFHVPKDISNFFNNELFFCLYHMIQIIFKEKIQLFIIYCVYHSNVLIDLLIQQNQLTFAIFAGLRSVPATILPAGQSAQHSHVPQ